MEKDLTLDDFDDDWHINCVIKNPVGFNLAIRHLNNKDGGLCLLRDGTFLQKIGRHNIALHATPFIQTKNGYSQIVWQPHPDSFTNL